jgi:hypothetical protein
VGKNLLIKIFFYLVLSAVLITAHLDLVALAVVLQIVLTLSMFFGFFWPARVFLFLLIAFSPWTLTFPALGGMVLAALLTLHGFDKYVSRLDWPWWKLTLFFLLSIGLAGSIIQIISMIEIGANLWISLVVFIFIAILIGQILPKKN